MNLKITFIDRAIGILVLIYIIIYIFNDYNILNKNDYIKLEKNYIVIENEESNNVIGVLKHNQDVRMIDNNVFINSKKGYLTDIEYTEDYKFIDNYYIIDQEIKEHVVKQIFNTNSDSYIVDYNNYEKYKNTEDFLLNVIRVIDNINMENYSFTKEKVQYEIEEDRVIINLKESRENYIKNIERSLILDSNVYINYYKIEKVLFLLEKLKNSNLDIIEKQDFFVSFCDTNLIDIDKNNIRINDMNFNYDLYNYKLTIE